MQNGFVHIVNPDLELWLVPHGKRLRRKANSFHPPRCVSAGQHASRISQLIHTVDGGSQVVAAGPRLKQVLK